MATRRAAAWLGLSRCTLDGYRVSAAVPGHASGRWMLKTVEAAGRH